MKGDESRIINGTRISEKKGSEFSVHRYVRMGKQTGIEHGLVVATSLATKTLAFLGNGRLGWWCYF